MFNSEATLRITLFLNSFIYCLTQICTKDLSLCVQSFGKICSPVSDLWTWYEIDTAWARVCISNHGLIGLKCCFQGI